MRIPMISLVAAGALALGGCAYGGLGFGVGAGDPYYGGGYGYGSPYYGGYGSAGYGYGGAGYGYGYASSPYYGWYDDYYYPGSGYYVYDRNHNRRQWTNRERAYWLARVSAIQHNRTAVQTRENWSGFRNRQATQTQTQSQTQANSRTTIRTSDQPRSGWRRRNRD